MVVVGTSVGQVGNGIFLRLRDPSSDSDELS